MVSIENLCFGEFGRKLFFLKRRREKAGTADVCDYNINQEAESLREDTGSGLYFERCATIKF